ncbi:FecCD family ABC transporter permease [Cytobacillus firmus]|jgi:iron complex transport system permease protein|uniref:FecCD family ABC transporter permease n=1 Tax=Bacillaceae TaxID=186817 RepID=UPI0013D03AF7|nr:MULTISPECIES: iron ABC transporter permease [Bacillaceae]MBG9444283.1 iron ABC transporter [Cytobacillus firmus]MBY6052333.1 iron ABC transporter permease [Cytobacillus firmus]MCC3648727.1 iron ABC transporter permease [Cytobacillus oceanisediminis]MCU1806892.1 iron ABC transporter permease [Cytobacillus firmus]URT70359.1 iron ABC transporter permease [Cytobacillus firmus]
MLLKTNSLRWAGLIAAALLLLVLMSFSIVYGYTDTTWKMAIDAFTNFDGTNEHIIIQSVRLPRALIAAAVGASLAIAGVLLQSLTKNPLAAPEIFGINAGAGFAVVITVTLFSISNLQVFTWVSFLGAAVSFIFVYIIGSIGREGLTPMKLTLAGAAMSAMFASMTQGFLVINETALEQVLFWLAGSVSGRKLETLAAVFPYLLAGWIFSLIIAGKLNVLSMGEDVAKGLGLKTGLLKLGAGIVIVLLSGGAVAVAGPIGFLGIVIPHLTRAVVGIDHRWVIPYAGLLGGMLLLIADIASRYIIMPQEVPVGVMTAVIGTPFFVYIARRGFNK